MTLRELALRSGNDAEFGREISINAAAREKRSREVYEPIVATEAVSRFFHASPDEQVAMLSERRSDLLGESALEALDRLTSSGGTGDGSFGAGLLRFATHDLDHRSIEALSDDATLGDLVDDTIRDGDPTRGRADRVAFGVTTAACGPMLADQRGQAIAMLEPPQHP